MLSTVIGLETSPRYLLHGGLRRRDGVGLRVVREQAGGEWKCEERLVEGLVTIYPLNLIEIK